MTPIVTGRIMMITDEKKGIDWTMWSTLTIVAVALIVFFPFACSRINEKLNIGDDNIVEELIEDVIEAKTGIDIDLTPNSEE